MEINKNQVLFGQKSVDKDSAIKAAGAVLVTNGNVVDAYVESMLKKELTDVTYIGNGVAIPHGLYEDQDKVMSSGISVLHYPQGIQYGSDTAYLVIGIAGKGNDHIEILQELAIKLSDNDYVETLIALEDESAFIQMLNS